MGRLLNSNETGSETPKNDWGSLIKKLGIKGLIPEEKMLKILESGAFGQTQPTTLTGDTKNYH
jgi:hypothetical protein